MLRIYWILSICSWLAHAQRVVDTEYGQVRGHLVNVYNGVEQTTVDVFYGIPFAKDTSGTRRFTRPESPDPWTGIFEADTIREMCPQLPGLIETVLPDWDSYDEDCLHLNIYTPGEAADPYPVMFWIYGGAYQQGGTVTYPGHYLASRGVVVVTVNYRMGKFGFQYTANDACPGNVGLWDQNFALQFVVNNIVNFGGDPSRITVFGESAGGASTSLNMLSPQSKDLFHQAITQSGSETNVWVVNDPSSHPEDYTRQVADELGCLMADDYEMMDCMRDLSWRQILYNSSVSCTPGHFCTGMAPVVDGPGGFLPDTPAELRKSGDIMNGPLISGSNKEDGSLFVTFWVPGIIADGCCNRTYFSYALRENIAGFFAPRLSNTTEEDCYHAFDYNYTPWPYIHDTDANRDMLVKLYTDWSFGAPWDRQLKEHQSVAPTYGYIYDYMSVNTSVPDWMGTIHGAEIDYIWGYPMMEFNEEVQNDSLVLPEGRSFNDMDFQYAMFIQELWTNFAKYGNPTPSAVVNPFGGVTTWPQFTHESMDVLYFGAESIDVITEYRQKDYAFWTEYILGMVEDEIDVEIDGD